jgi:Rha family phage regulatory protein
MSTALVSLVNGIPTTTSLKVAELFAKSHKNVLRDIERVLSQVSENFGRLNFELSSYANQQGKKQPMYLLTKDGVCFLVMGYTGEKASQFKEAYIEAFNCMERQLEAQRTAPAVPPLSTTSDRRKLNNLVREWAALSGQSFPDCWA